MLWFKKPPEAVAPGGATEVIVAAALAVPMSPEQFLHKLSVLQRNVETDGGIEAFIAALNAKQVLFATALDETALNTLDQEALESLLDTVFSARRRLYPHLVRLGMPQVIAGIRDLLYGAAPLADRLKQFAMQIEVDVAADRETRKQAGKIQRAAFDFGAEMLHFRAPERYPLMCRWVWDQNTVSGALREFIRGNDAMSQVPLGDTPEMFEGAREWIAEQLTGQGIYRDMHFWVDLILAQAYTEYFRSMAEGMLSSDFGRGITASEHLRKFLGIDAPLREGLSRVKHDSAA